MRLQPHHEQYLERTARYLSKQLGRRVTALEVLHLLVDAAIADEGVYEPGTGAVLRTDTRTAVQPERDPARAGEPAGLSAPSLLLRPLEDED